MIKSHCVFFKQCISVSRNEYTLQHDTDDVLIQRVAVSGLIFCSVYIGPAQFTVPDKGTFERRTIREQYNNFTMLNVLCNFATTGIEYIGRLVMKQRNI